MDVVYDSAGQVKGYYVLDGFGGVHAVGNVLPASQTPYWGWNIARALCVIRNTTGQPQPTGGGAVSDPLTADFEVNLNSQTSYLEAAFLDRSSGEIASWRWDFGDGTTSYEQNPTHTYGSPGWYTVRLTITGPERGSVAERSKQVRAGMSP